MARFGVRFDAQGVLAGSKDAARCIGYLTKYLTKQVGDCHQADTDAAGTMRPGWRRRCGSSRARRGAQLAPVRHPAQNTRPGLVPGRCKGKGHDPDHLGYAGRRVLASRKWSGKTLADHRADRKQWLLTTLGVSATDPARYSWEPVAPADPDHMDHARRLLHAVADRLRWQPRSPKPDAERCARSARSFGNREGSVMARNPESTDAFGAAIVPRLRGVRNRRQASKGMTLASCSRCR